ncbi:beta-ketoacyl synthase N-terminal-like domain-containing protein [Streptomyces sp. NPDC004610]|uniref:beta-ketoacyl synthase N-terminal-like domain-containing protein n=1 Tax=unclassified Streptomyces TaxID=2593676 RepID=UPI00339F851E
MIASGPGLVLARRTPGRGRGRRRAGERRRPRDLQPDTASASGMTALALAVAALRADECPAALVGGVFVLCDRARPLDAAADGYIRGEGAVCLLLKPPEAALADDDPVYGEGESGPRARRTVRTRGGTGEGGH